MTGLAQETVDKLLDFNQKLDISLLDNVVAAMYTSTGQEQKMAQEVLTTLKEHPDAWTKVGETKSIIIFNFYNRWTQSLSSPPTSRPSITLCRYFIFLV